MMRIYLAGPMRGYPKLNFPAFEKAAADLRARGYVVYNPAEHDPEHLGSDGKFDIKLALAADLAWICSEADAVALLPGWQGSKGAQAEYFTARAIGIHTIELAEEYKE